MVSPASDRGRPLADPSSRRRWLAVGGAVLFHLLILTLFLRGHADRPLRIGAGEGTMDVALSGFSRGSTPTPPVRTPAASRPPAAPSTAKPAPEGIKARSVLAIVSEILVIPLAEQTITPQPLTPPAPIAPAVVSAALSGPSGATCDLAGAVQRLIQADPPTHAAVIGIPRQDRSVANAVLLWNGQWIGEAQVGGVATLATLQSSIRQVVAAATPTCREQLMAGPRFMLAPEQDGMMVLAVGSGNWRWSELLAAAN